MGTALIVPGHTLVSEGRAHHSDGTPVKVGTTGGVGRGLCSCGAMSRSLASGGARKSWHRHHKASIGATAL